SDLAGLLLVADLLRGLPEADEWRETATAGLHAHAAVQTLADGADFEASIPYHRLTTEMLLAAVLVLERRGGDAAALRPLLRRRIDYTAHYTKPDGLAPQIGDNDDGRFLVLGEHGADRRDHRALLSVAAVLFDDPALLALAGDRCEDALWVHGPASLDRVAARARAIEPRVTSALFREAGTVILRGGGLYVHVEAGGVGLSGHGGHAHNDTLSIEVQAEGEDLIVDPGTGGYTADLVVRDRFRSTAAHNTVRVDGSEINPLPANPFRLPGIDRPSIARAVFRRHFDLIEALHRGYARLADPVVHRRILLLNRTTRRLLIEDALEGKGTHRLEWFFHLAPRVLGRIEEDGRSFLGHAGKVRFRLRADQAPEGVRFTLAPDLFSPGYGRTEPATTLCLAWEGGLPVSARFHLCVEDVRREEA
ncbi:MAG TPA: alginate lyase family protein, partial [Candidatus Polarisedimenticolia bacterium]|nr:alginate lyase family protein [Candidatus Polarisedimenticolia bacterium]